MTELLLGNVAVVEVAKQLDDDGREVGEERVDRSDLGNRITTVQFPEGVDLEEQVAQVAGLWPYHSDADGPEWVESDDELLAAAVARHFTTPDHKCRVGRPRGWKENS